MFNRNRTSTAGALARQCWDLLRQNTEWMKIPLISGAGVAVVTIIFGIVGFIGVMLFGGSSSDSNQNASTIQAIVGVVFLFLYYFATYTIIIYAETALVSVVL